MSNTLKTLNIKIGAEISDLEKKMKRAASVMRREGRNLSNLGNELSVAVSLPLIGIGASALKSAGQLEQLRLAMQTTMTDGGRSIEEARTELDMLRKSALAPGLDFEQAVKASIRLQNVGMSAEKARATIEELANAISMSGGTAEDLDGVTMQMAQMISKGKVLAADLRIIQERMPKITSLMQEAFGVRTAEQLQELGVSGEEFVSKITEKMKGLSRVQGGLSNSFVNFGVSIKMSMAAIGDEIDKTFDVRGNLEKFANTIGSLSEKFAALDTDTKKTIVTTLALAAAAGPVIKAYGLMKMTMATVIDGMRSMVGVTKNVTTGVLNAAAAFQKMDAITKATTIGLVVAGIAAAVVVFKQLNSQVSQAERLQIALNDVQTQAAQSIVAEKLEAERLVKILNDENETRDRKEAALKRLNELSPKYFEGLSIEKSSVDDVNVAYQSYIDNLLKAARARASQDKIIELEKQRITLLNRLETAKDGIKSVGEAWDVLMQGSGGRLDKTLKSQISAIEEQQKALAQLAADTENIGQSSPIASTGTTTTTTTTKTKGADDSTTKQKDALGELAKAYAKADRELKVYNDTAAAAADKKAALREAINTLLEQGVDPASNQIETLRMRLISLDAQTLTSAGIQAVTIEPMIALTGVMESQVEQVTAAQRAWQRFGETVSEMAAAAGAAMLDAAAAGETSFGKLGKAALKSAADVVRAALMKFVATTIEKTAMASGPFGAILAPAAGAAAGIAFNNIIKGLKIPALAEGAVVTKPTLALIGEAGPEIVAPPQKLPGLATMMGMERQGNNNGNGYIAETRIKGSDLIVMIREAAISEKRRTGNSFILNNQ